MIKLLATTILSLSILGGGATAVPIQRTEVETQMKYKYRQKGKMTVYTMRKLRNYMKSLQMSLN